MILFTRAVARDLRAVLARCGPGRAAGPAPAAVVVRACGGVRTVTAVASGGVVVAHTAPAPDGPDGIAVLPATVLADAEGATDAPVVLDRTSKARGTVRWDAGGVTHTRPVALVLPGTQHDPPAVPELTPVPDRLLGALDGCGRAAARTDGRYALSRVQLRGRAGTVAGTDGKLAVLFHGFAFLFAGDVLVPATGLFGVKPLARAGAVRVGLGPAHLAVAAGPWAVLLPVAIGVKYPDVAGVVPRHAATTVALDPADAEELLAALPGLPGAADEHRPVTLDAGPTVAVRGRDAGSGALREVVLPRSTTSGPPVRLALDRRLLARGLALRCHALKLDPDRPLVAEGDGVTVVAAPLDPALAVPPAADGAVAIEYPRRNTLMKTNDPPGPAAVRGDPPDPLAAAEELRDVLADAAARAARLVAALRAGRREKKVLASVYAGLKQLNLGAPDGTP